jgi:hypothetical protein
MLKGCQKDQSLTIVICVCDVNVKYCVTLLQITASVHNDQW